MLSTPDIGAPAERRLGRRWAFMTPPEHLGFFARRSLRVLHSHELGLPIGGSTASGKWANIGFITRELGGVFPTSPRRG